MIHDHKASHLDLGAEVLAQGVRFRVWAPKCRQVEVVVEEHGNIIPLAAEGNGYFSGIVPQIGAGTLYRYRLNGDQQYPDPCSR
ncbi:MAG: hypothetical protein ACREQ3_01900, partial [Candidatus Binatia bacterium]